MSGVLAPNLPTNCDSTVAQAERELEVPTYIDGENATPFIDAPGDGSFADPYLGMNRAGGSNPGVGICTGFVYQTAAEVAAGPEIFSGWTEDDQGNPVESGESQTPLPRTPQDGQTIGGIAVATDALDPNDFVVTKLPITVTEGADINDTANFVITDTAAVDGAVMDVGGTGAINDTGETVGIGDLVWGKVPVV